ncbi:MAG: SAM-dependent methyltransferase [Acidiferrobacteraceae bacterium]|nr:SAM-dependent methyltransferase [Acidiferrobacteraceae bacterium]|tara:strand:+ start:1006 stop:2268 length:1263 start_codon:yes stop_codon:yes gene_type:complete
MKQGDFYRKENCRLCDSSTLEKSLVLTPTPPGNNFLKEIQEGFKEKEYPLELYFCCECFHIQLGHVVDPSFLFQNNYSYVSSTSSVFVKHLEDYSKYVIDKFDLRKDSLIVDIGSNDGTCLSFFKESGMRVLGVDPAKEVCDIAIDNGIDTLNDFFTANLANEIENKYGQASLITSHNACAHIDDLSSVIKGVESLLHETGVFIMEVGYFLDVFENKWFDTIYHEHLDFHTVAPLEKMFEKNNMELIRVERVSPQGGSIRVFSQKKNGVHHKDSTVQELIDLESQIGLDSSKTLKNFEKNINIVKDDFKTIIRDIKSDGATVAAFGAATKATTLMYHFQLDKEDIEFIVDDNPLKQNVFSPGKHIPVVSSEKIYEQMPDYIVILAWNFAESIMQQHKKYLELGGSFILPMPEPVVVDSLK